MGTIFRPLGGPLGNLPEMDHDLTSLLCGSWNPVVGILLGYFHVEGFSTCWHEQSFAHSEPFVFYAVFYPLCTFCCSARSGN